MKEQIEEMAEIMCGDYADGICAVDGHICNHNCESRLSAAHLYNAGYRKQKENTVEVVRCNDCIFGNVDKEGSGSVQCQNRDVPWRRYKEEFVMRPQDYCSYARAKMKGGAE